MKKRIETNNNMTHDFEKGMSKEDYLRKYFKPRIYNIEIPTMRKVAVLEKNLLGRLNKMPLVCGHCLNSNVRAVDDNDRNPDLITLSDFMFYHTYWCDDCNAETERVFLEFDKRGVQTT